MSRKHYEALAREIRAALSACNEEQQLGIKRAVVGIARACAADSEKFDERRFLRACGIEAERR